MESIIWIIAFCIGNNNSTRGSIWKIIIESKSDFGEETSKNREAKEKNTLKKEKPKTNALNPERERQEISLKDFDRDEIRMEENYLG